MKRGKKEEKKRETKRMQREIKKEYMDISIQKDKGEGVMSQKMRQTSSNER
jgi:hypothetical protein